MCVLLCDLVLYSVVGEVSLNGELLVVISALNLRTSFTQVLKRVWPAAQRDSIFWSTIRHCPSTEGDQLVDYWVVVNQSTNHIPSPSSDRNQCIRLQFNVAMIGQTIIQSSDAPLTRDQLTCKIQYSANGGFLCLCDV